MDFILLWWEVIGGFEEGEWYDLICVINKIFMVVVGECSIEV